MRRFLFFLLLVGLIAFGVYRWNALNGTLPGRRASERFTPLEHPRIDLKDVQVLAAIDAEYSKLIDTVVPAVVCIRSRGVAPMDPFEMLLRGNRGGQVKRSLGSGVIVSQEGHILTNAHVIAGMSEIVVQMTDGRLVPARLIGADKQTDIAVLRISVPKIDALPLGNSDEVRVGQMVFAIGNPFGLQETVTQGIISAKGRSISDNGVEFIQTDAAVNQGNSGGPLLNLRGEVIGINSAIYSETGGWLGISFAIPSNTARRALESIIRVGRVVRPFLGVLMGDLTDDLARQFKAPDRAGALIHDVLPNSPAAQAGLRPGDIIRKLNGVEIKSSTDLRNRIAQTDIGTQAVIVFLRDGVEQSATAQIVESPETATAQPPPAPQTLPRLPQNSPQNNPNGQNPQNPQKVRPAVAALLSGVQVGAIPSTQRPQLPENVDGVFVLGLDPETLAAKQLRPTDVIEEINHQRVRSVAEFETVAQGLPPGKQVLLHIARGDSRLFVVIAPE